MMHFYFFDIKRIWRNNTKLYSCSWKDTIEGPLSPTPTPSPRRSWGWIRLIVGFQPLMVILPNAFGGVCRCMCGDLICGPVLFGLKDLPPTILECQATDLIAPGEQKGITQTIYTDSETPSRMPNSLMPSAKLRSANLPFFTSLVWRGRDRTPISHTPNGDSNHYATRGREKVMSVSE